MIMMKMKKICSVLAAAVLLLTGCKNNSSLTAEPAETTAQTGTSASASETTETTSESAGSSAEQSGSETGSSAQTTGSTTQQSTSGTAGTTSAPASSSGSTQTTGSVTTAPPVQKKPLTTKLSALTAKGTVYALADAGNGRAVAACHNNTSGSTAYLIDTAADSVTASVRLSASYEQILGVSPDNELIAYNYYWDWEKGFPIYYYNFETGQRRTVSLKMLSKDDGPTLQYDPATGSVYLLVSDGVYVCDRNGNGRRFHKTGERAQTSNALSASSGICFDNECARNNQSGMEVVAYDAAFCNRLYSFPNYYTTVKSMNSRLICTEGTYVEEKEKTVTNAFIRDLRTGAELNSYQLYEGQHDLFTSEDSDYAMMVKWNEKSWYPSEIIPFDPVAGKRVKTGISLKKTSHDVQFCCLKDSGIWVAAVTEGNGRNAVPRLMLIDPAQADFSTGFEKVYSYGAAVEDRQLGAEFQSLHEITERIERETGVRVLIGNEVLGADEPSGYRLVSFEESEYYTLSDFRKALLYLEGELKKYPEGFFDHFSRTTSSGGLRVGVRFLIVDSLITTTPGSSFTAGGVAYDGAAWYNIALGVNMMYENDKSIHHELWHIIEDRLNDAGRSLDSDKWEACNPRKFSYTNDFNSYYSHYDYDAYTLSSVLWEDNPKFDNIYFSRDYSTVNGQEDRATLIERVFEEPSYYGKEALFRDGLEMVEASPHLKAKLGVLAEAVKKEFGYVYWEQIYQEQRAAA